MLSPEAMERYIQAVHDAWLTRISACEYSLPWQIDTLTDLILNALVVVASLVVYDYCEYVLRYNVLFADTAVLD